eukprot:SAG31_NODE_42541_length_271_cov_0.598837_1_plen_38_part_01
MAMASHPGLAPSMSDYIVFMLCPALDTAGKQYNHSFGT